MRKHKLKYQAGGYAWSNPDVQIPNNPYDIPLYEMDPNTMLSPATPGLMDRTGIDAFANSPFGQNLQKRYTRAGFDTSINQDTNTIRFTRGTGIMQDSPYTKGFNLLSNGVTGIANWMSNNKLKDQEERQVNASLQPRYWENMERYGLNNLPAYTKYGGAGTEEDYMFEGIAHAGNPYGRISVYGSYMTPAVPKYQAGGPTASKAREILHDGKIHGKPITDKQRKYFGAIVSSAKNAKKQAGGSAGRRRRGNSEEVAAPTITAGASGYNIPEVEVTAQIPSWYKYSQQFEDQFPISQRIAQYLDPLARATGSSETQYPERIDREYAKDRNNYIARALILDRAGNNFNEGEQEIINNSIYKGKSKEYVYKNPQKLPIAGDNSAVNTLYENDWLTQVPLARQVIQRLARNQISDADVARGFKEKGDQSEDSKTKKEYSSKKFDPLAQYLGNNQGVEPSRYAPKNDYLDFLPSYSLKSRLGINPQFRELTSQFVGNEQLKNAPIFTQGLSASPYGESPDLGHYKSGAAWDAERNLPYVFVSDAWDFDPQDYATRYQQGQANRNPQQSYEQAYLLHKAGNPYKIYDRFYFDPNTGDYIDDNTLPNTKKTGGKMAMKQAGGSPIQPLDPSKKGTFKALAKRKGLSMDALAADIKANPEDYSTAAKRKANFYRNIVKQAGGPVQETYGLPPELEGLANVNAEEGEVFEDRAGNYNKVADDAGTHEEGGVMLSDVNRVLEDTSDKRKDKNSKVLKMSPDDVERMFGFRPKRAMSHASAFEYVNGEYDKERKKYTDAMARIGDRKNLDKYMVNSANLDAQNLQSVPDSAEVFDALYMHQEAIKEAAGISDNGGNKAKFGGKYKMQTGGTVPFNPYTGGVTQRGRTTPAGNSNAFSYQGGLPALTQAWQQAGFDMTGITTPGQFQGRTYDQLLSTPEGRDVLRTMWDQGNTARGLQQKLLTDRYPQGNFRGSDLSDADLSTLRDAYVDNMLGVRTITPSVSTVTTPPTDVPVTTPSPVVPSRIPPNTGVTINPRFPDNPRSRFYEPTYWDELAPGVISLADSMNRDPELYNPQEFHQLRYKLQDPSAAMAANQADFNAAADVVGNVAPGSSGVALSNLANLSAQKYRANNQIMGQYDNQNAQIKNQEILYNTQVRDRQSAADAQSRGNYYQNVLQARDNQRLQRLKAIEDLGRVAQLKRRQNRSGNLLLQMTPAFDQYGEYNGYQYQPYVNPALGIAQPPTPAATNRRTNNGSTKTTTTWKLGDRVVKTTTNSGR